MTYYFGLSAQLLGGRGKANELKIIICAFCGEEIRQHFTVVLKILTLIVQI